MESYKYNPYINKVLENIALSIKQEVDIYHLLEKAIQVYKTELQCEKGLILKEEANKDYSPFITLVYPDPRRNSILPDHESVLKVLPSLNDKQIWSSFSGSFPVSGKLNSEEFFHMFHLKGFGYLILIKRNGRLQNEILESLDDVNNKLANACISATDL